MNFENTLLPRTTNRKPTPDDLLETQSSKGDCSTNWCGYECSNVYRPYQSNGCNYMVEEVTELDDVNDDSLSLISYFSLFTFLNLNPILFSLEPNKIFTRMS